MRIDPSLLFNDSGRMISDKPVIKSLKNLCSLNQQLASHQLDALTKNNEGIATNKSESNTLEPTEDSKIKSININKTIDIIIDNSDIDDEKEPVPDMENGTDSKLATDADIDNKTDTTPADKTDETDTDKNIDKKIHIDKHMTIDVDNDGDIDVDIDVDIDIHIMDEDTAAKEAGKKTVMAIMISQYRVDAILGGDPDDESNPMYIPEW